MMDRDSILLQDDPGSIGSVDQVVIQDDSRLDDGENMSLLHPSLKGGRFFPSSSYDSRLQLVLRQITWSRVKVGVVIGILLLMIALFSTESEEDQQRHLIAAQKASPFFFYVAEQSPVEMLQAFVRVQGGMNRSTILVIGLEKIQDGGVAWEPVASVQLNLAEEQLAEDYMFEVMEKAPYAGYRFNITTNSQEPLGMTFQVKHLPGMVRYQVIFAAAILVGVYVLIVFELVHRTIAAMFGAFVALAILSKLHSRPTLEEVVSWIDFETCGLLFGMMVMVGIFSGTGFFEWAAVHAYKLSKGKVWRLIVILCTFTAVLSAFLDNVTTILLLTPVTIRLCRVLEIPPQQILISLVMFSNLGGTATIVGDPPNIIIVNDSGIQLAHPIDFMTFSLHVGPGVILACLASFLVVKKLSQPLLQREPNMGKRKEIEIWRRTAKKLREDNEEEKAVRRKLEEYISGLESGLQNQPDKPLFIDVKELEEKYKITDMVLCVNSCIILSIVILFFFLHSAVQMHLSLAWIAIIGAMAHMLISGIRDIEEVLEKVEFATLMFFAGLFVLMRALEELGLIDFIGEQTSALIEQVPVGDGRLAAAVVLIMWISAIVSAFIDNIPYTAAMVPVVVRLGDGTLGLPLTPLVWALVFGTCFGGNGTLIGASANVVAAGISEAQGYPIRFNFFFRTGFPVMLASVFTATVYLLLTHVLIPWY